MEPTFEDREYLIIDELSYYLRLPLRDEVVVFRYPKDPRQFFIKRIIGLPGERVEIHNGRITIFNTEFPKGFLLDEMYLSPPNRPTNPESVAIVPEGMYFVLGDNRDFSSDSRVWGMLERNLIVGKVFLRAWPFNRASILK